MASVKRSASTVFNFIIWFIFIASIGITGISLFVPEALADEPSSGLVGWWRAEGNANDSAGTNNGTLQGGATYATGKVGQAFSFDGADDYVNVPYSSSLDLQDSLTISAWINSTNNSSQNRAIAGKAGGYQIFVKEGGLLVFGFYNGSVWTLLQSSVYIAENTWVHVAGTFNSADGTLLIYINGLHDTSLVTAQRLSADANPVKIGGFGSDGAPFSGRIDEVKVFNRALNASEVANLAGFNFISQTGVPLSTTIVSNPVTVSFIGGSSVISITGGEYSISTDGSTWSDYSSTTPATVSLNNQVKVRQTSSGSNSTMTTATLTIGGVSADFNVTTAASGDPNANGLVAWWRAENNAYDSVGGNHGTIMNDTTYAAGKVGQAFSFDGNGDYVSIPQSANLPIRGTNSFTLAAWVKNTDGSMFNIFAFRPSSSSNLQFYVNGTKIIIWVPEHTLASIDHNVVSTAWNHFVYTRDGNTWRLYVNGNQVGTDIVDTIDLGNPISTQNIGGPGCLCGQWANGQIDEVKIYNRALPASDVAALYCAGGGVSCNQIPDAFSFTAQTGMPLSTTIASNPITVSGISFGAAISITGGEYSISANGGSSWNTWTSSAGTVFANNQVKVRQTSSASNSATTTATLNIGGVTADFNVTTAVSGDPDASGLVAWWKAENNAYDSVGGNHGTAMNGATYASGNVGQAFSFDGVNDYVQVPDSPSFNIGAGDFSLTVWANYAAVRSGPYGSLANVFIGQDEGSGGNHKWIFYSADGGLYFHINNSGNTFLGPFAFTPQTGQWYHLTVTRSAALYSFYVNGTLAGTMTNSTSIPDVNAPLTIGQAEGIGFFNGLIDEVKIFNRSLSSTEVATLFGKYTLTITKDGTGSGTVTSNPSGIDCGSTCSYPFDDGTHVDISVEAAAGSTFSTWSGACTGNGTPCTVVMSEARAVTATFNSKAEFSGTPLTGQVPLNVTFSDASTHSPTTWSWTFGDGGTSTVKNPVHTYRTNGTYEVTLTATGAGGASTMTKTGYVVVGPDACSTPPYKIGGTPHDYDTIQHAYDPMGSNTMQIQALVFTGGLTLNQDYNITFQGGYDCGFTSNAGESILSDKLTIQHGKVTIEKIIIK